jgi:hypothetical protein
MEGRAANGGNGSGFRTTETGDDAPDLEPVNNGWPSLELMYEEYSTGCKYFGSVNGGAVFPIEMKDLMWVTKFQEWCGRNFRFIPKAITKEAFADYRDAALLKATKRDTEVGYTPEEKTADVVMRMLQRQLPRVVQLWESDKEDLSQEGFFEILEIEGKVYVVIGSKTLYYRIKRWEMDFKMGTKLDLDMVTKYLKSVAAFQFDRTSGRGPGVSGGNKYRSQYALPIEFVQGYERVIA